MFQIVSIPVISPSSSSASVLLLCYLLTSYLAILSQHRAGCFSQPYSSTRTRIIAIIHFDIFLLCSKVKWCSTLKKECVTWLLLFEDVISDSFFLSELLAGWGHETVELIWAIALMAGSRSEIKLQKLTSFYDQQRCHVRRNVSERVRRETLFWILLVIMIIAELKVVFALLMIMHASMLLTPVLRSLAQVMCARQSASRSSSTIFCKKIHASVIQHARFNWWMSFKQDQASEKLIQST